MEIRSFLGDIYHNIVGESRHPSFNEITPGEKMVGYIKDGVVYQMCDVGDHYAAFESLNTVVQDRYNTIMVGGSKNSFHIYGETDNIETILALHELIKYLINDYPTLSEINLSVIYPGLNSVSIKRNSDGSLSNATETLNNFEEVIKNVELDQILENLTARKNEKEKKGFIASLRR